LTPCDRALHLVDERLVAEDAPGGPLAPVDGAAVLLTCPSASRSSRVATATLPAASCTWVTVLSSRPWPRPRICARRSVRLAEVGERRGTSGCDWVVIRSTFWRVWVTTWLLTLTARFSSAVSCAMLRRMLRRSRSVVVAASRRRSETRSVTAQVAR
jgi:hypothetical protein